MNVAGAIIEHDEIVARAVHFGETQHDGVDPNNDSYAISNGEGGSRLGCVGMDLQARTPAATVPGC